MTESGLAKRKPHQRDDDDEGDGQVKAEQTVETRTRVTTWLGEFPHTQTPSRAGKLGIHSGMSSFTFTLNVTRREKVGRVTR